MVQVEGSRDKMERRDRGGVRERSHHLHIAWKSLGGRLELNWGPLLILVRSFSIVIQLSTFLILWVLSSQPSPFGPSASICGFIVISSYTRYDALSEDVVG